MQNNKKLDNAISLKPDSWGICKFFVLHQLWKHQERTQM